MGIQSESKPPGPKPPINHDISDLSWLSKICQAASFFAIALCPLRNIQDNKLLKDMDDIKAWNRNIGQGLELDILEGFLYLESKSYMSWNTSGWTNCVEILLGELNFAMFFVVSILLKLAISW